MTHPVLVTGAAGRVGVDGLVAEALRRRGLPVRAMVRLEDERAEGLRATGAEAVGPLTHPADVGRALAGCRRMDFDTITKSVV
jgi:nucleoside-diphosphate-sugar epimerase